MCTLMIMIFLQIDRHCLNCDRMEQTACECPCECPMNVDCSTLKQNNIVIPPCLNSCEATLSSFCHCSASAGTFHLHQSIHHPLLSKVKSCTIHECHSYLTYK